MPEENETLKDRPVRVEIREQMLWVTLQDGRVIGAPLAWYPWLEKATSEQQANTELSPFSIDWVDLDEGIDIEAMLQGIHSTEAMG